MCNVATVLSLVLVLAACGGGEAGSDADQSSFLSSTSTPRGAVREVAQDQTLSLSSEHDPVDPGIGLFAAQTVVLGEITSVEGPFWNQDSGQKWENDDGTGPREVGDYTIPVMYYQIGLKPERMLVDAIGLTDPVVEFLVPTYHMDDVEGPLPVGLFAVGDRVITALAIDIFYPRAEPVLALQLFHGTAFHVDADDTVRSWWRYANERARADNPDVPAIDEKPVGLASFIEEFPALRSESHPDWEPYRPIQTETEERLSGIIEYLETGVLPPGYEESTG